MFDFINSSLKSSLAPDQTLSSATLMALQASARSDAITELLRTQDLRNSQAGSDSGYKKLLMDGVDDSVIAAFSPYPEYPNYRDNAGDINGQIIDNQIVQGLMQGRSFYIDGALEWISP